MAYFEVISADLTHCTDRGIGMFVDQIYEVLPSDEVGLARLHSLGRAFVCVSRYYRVKAQQFARFNYSCDHGLSCE